MLSNNIRLVGASFGPIANLCLQDGLVRIGGHGFNLLPVLATLINIISGFIYAKRQPRSARIQLYLMAAVFLPCFINHLPDLFFTGRSTICSRS